MSRSELVRRSGLLVGLGAMLALSACSGQAQGTAEDQKIIDEARDGVAASAVSTDLYIGNPSPEMCDGKTYKIGSDIFSSNEEFANAYVEGLKKVAADVGCIDLSVLYNEVDAQRAVADAQTLAGQHVDGIVNLQVLAAANAGVMKVYDDAGIPVVAGAVPASGATFVGVPDYKSGLDAGAFLAKAYESDVPDAPLPWLLIGEFPDGGQLSLDRLNGIVDGIKSVIPDIPEEQIIRIDTKADPVNTRDRALEQINKIPKDAKILASAINDSTTYAIFQALQQSGRADNSYLMGIGGVNPGGLKYVCENPAFVGTMSHRPETWANYLLPAIIDRIQGKSVPPSIDVPWVILTRENMKETYPDAPC